MSVRESEGGIESESESEREGEGEGEGEVDFQFFALTRQSLQAHVNVQSNKGMCVRFLCARTAQLPFCAAQNTGLC